MQVYVSTQPEMFIVNIPLNPVQWQREDTHSKSDFPSLISVWPVNKLIRNRLSTANCYLISRLLRPTAPLMPGRARMSGETMGLLVACQNAHVVSEMKDPVNHQKEACAVRIPWPRVFDSLGGMSQRLGHWTTHGRSRREQGTWDAFSVQGCPSEWMVRTLPENGSSPSPCIPLSLPFISSAPLNYL